MLSYKQLERIIKGSANHRRIQILDLIEKNPELSVSEISAAVKSDIKNVSEHVRKLTIAGLVTKEIKAAIFATNLLQEELVFYNSIEL